MPPGVDRRHGAPSRPIDQVAEQHGEQQLPVVERVPFEGQARSAARAPSHSPRNWMRTLVTCSGQFNGQKSVNNTVVFSGLVAAVRRARTPDRRWLRFGRAAAEPSAAQQRSPFRCGRRTRRSRDALAPGQTEELVVLEPVLPPQLRRAAIHASGVVRGHRERLHHVRRAAAAGRGRAGRGLRRSR